VRDHKLNIIKHAVSEFFPDCTILLFGSRARQDHSPSSDYDLVIITNETLDIEQKWFYQAQIRKTLAQEKIPIDIIIQSENEFKINKARSGHIMRYASQEGVVI